MPDRQRYDAIGSGRAFLSSFLNVIAFGVCVLLFVALATLGIFFAIAIVTIFAIAFLWLRINRSRAQKKQRHTVIACKNCDYIGTMSSTAVRLSNEPMGDGQQSYMGRAKSWHNAGHIYDVMSALSGNPMPPHITCPECGSSDCEVVDFHNDADVSSPSQP